jgi:hypothetical protein
MDIRNEFSEAQAQELLSRDTDQLYELLGMRIKAVEEDLEKQGTFVPQVEYSAHMGPAEDLSKIGRRMLNKVHVQTYGLVCGTDPEDDEDRKKILDALGISVDAAVVVLAGVLVSTFGLAAAFAGVLAALIIKRFAVPALGEGHAGICELWAEYLPSQ